MLEKSIESRNNRSNAIGRENSGANDASRDSEEPDDADNDDGGLVPFGGGSQSK